MNVDKPEPPFGNTAMNGPRVSEDQMRSHQLRIAQMASEKPQIKNITEGP